MSTGTAPQCFDCTRLRPLAPGTGWHCEAYPRGIPKNILVNQVDHRLPHEGDHGLQFLAASVVCAAGVILMTPEGRVLMLRRGPGSGDAQGSWAFPGGKLEDGETAEEAARRECVEEIGHPPPEVLREWTRRIRDDVDYTTFVGRVEEEFVPRLNGEHNQWAWVDARGLLEEAAARGDAEFKESEIASFKDVPLNSNGRTDHLLSGLEGILNSLEDRVGGAYRMDESKVDRILARLGVE